MILSSKPLPPPRTVNIITGDRDVPSQCRSYVGNVFRGPTAPKYLEDLTFSSRDLKGVPRNVDDSVVITTVILEYEVRRILVDTGSSANVMFWDCFQKLGIPEDQLQPCHFPLISFTCHQAMVASRVIIVVTVGDSDARSKQIFLEFLVVRATSAYNIIFGRPSLISLKAAVSPYYQCIKFSTTRGEGRAQSNPEVTRNYYVLSNTRHLIQQTLSIHTSSSATQSAMPPELPPDVAMHTLPPRIRHPLQPQPKIHPPSPATTAAHLPNRSSKYLWTTRTPLGPSISALPCP